MVLTKDHVKVLLQIIPKNSQDFMTLPAIASMQHYKYLNETLTEL